MKLEDVRKLCDAATPGPWRADMEKSTGPVVIAADEKCWEGAIEYEVWNCDDQLCGCEMIRDEWRNDAKFIAAARTLLPKLVAVAEAAKRFQDRARACADDAQWGMQDDYDYWETKLLNALAAVEGDE